MKSHGKFSLGFVGAALVAILLVTTSMASARLKPNGKNKGIVHKVTGTPNLTILDGNNVTSYYESNGQNPADVSGTWSGQFPRGSGVGDEYQEGVVICGQVYDGGLPVIRAEGNTYYTSMEPGKIIQNAQGMTTGAADPNGPDARIWRVRSDISPTTPANSIPDLTIDVASLDNIPTNQVTPAQIQSMVDQYRTDWTQWPADQGAPWYIDTVGTLLYNNAAQTFDPSNPHDIPGVPGATQTIWFVCNDLDPATSALLGSPSTGIEEQTTLWDYASSTPLNDIFFQQAKLIYEGTPTSNTNSVIDSAYVVQWRDPDVGDYSVELSGSDSTLGLGFGWSAPYNSRYAAIGLAPSCTAIDFLQGPSHYTGNPNDSAVIDFQWRKGYRYYYLDSPEPYANEKGYLPGSDPQWPLTTYAYFAAGSSQLGDPNWGGSDGAVEFYNLCKGYLPYSATWPATGTPIYTASGYASGHNIVTNYALPGNPVTGTGWIDGIDLAPSDRRDMEVSGPFTWKLHDTIEVVTAEVDGLGVSNTSSVAVMEYNDQYAKYAFENLFKLPSAPLSPSVAVTALNDTIVLNWGSDQQRVTADETTSGGGFSFEGYNVYQLPSPGATLSDAVRIATYDVKDGITTVLSTEVDPTTGIPVEVPVEFGTDSGIKRYIDITNDAIRQAPLVDGQAYYFAVTAYSVYHSQPGQTPPPFQALESPLTVMTITPHSANPGVVYGSAPGDTVNILHSKGVATVSILPTVVDPKAVTGDNYNITFNSSDSIQIPVYDASTGDTVFSNFPNTQWILTDATTNKTVYTGTYLNSNYTPSSPGHPRASYTSMVQSGLKFGFNSGADAPVVDGIQWQLSGIPFFADPNVTVAIKSVTYTPASNQNIQGVNWGGGYFGGGMDFGANFFGSSLSPAQSIVPIKIVFSSDPSKQQHAYFYERGGTPNYGYVGYGTFPGQVFDMSNPASPRQLNVASTEQSPDQSMVWAPTAASDGGRFYLFILNSTYDGNTPDVSGSKHPDYTKLNILNDAGQFDVLYAMWLNEISASAPLFQNGDVLTVDVNVPPTLSGSSSSDLYTINTKGLQETSGNVAEAKTNVQQVNIFPNPYYGWQYRETNALNKVVTINHLPQVATIRIYNLAGVLVKTIYKNDNTQFATWNLRNESDLPVASGIYIIYVDMGKLGSKILKFAMVQQQQVLPNY